MHCYRHFKRRIKNDEIIGGGVCLPHWVWISGWSWQKFEWFCIVFLVALVKKKKKERKGLWYVEVSVCICIVTVVFWTIYFVVGTFVIVFLTVFLFFFALPFFFFFSFLLLLFRFTYRRRPLCDTFNLFVGFPQLPDYDVNRPVLHPEIVDIAVRLIQEFDTLEFKEQGWGVVIHWGVVLRFTESCFWRI